MVSAFMDATRGFGFPLTPSELAGVSSARAERGRTPLLCSPGKAWLSYGSNDEGYWNYDKFSVQVTELSDCFDYLYPGHQMILEVDHSSGHTKTLPGRLCTDDMGLGIGGKKLATRDTVITEGCLGETLVYRATWMDGTVEREVIYRRLEINDIKHFVYKDDDQPPYLAPGTPKYDAEVLVPAKRRKGVNGDPIQEMKKISGYVGKNKGIFQILVEKGSYLPGMRGSFAPKQVGRLLAEAKTLRDPSLDAPLVLSSCMNFASEKRFCLRHGSSAAFEKISHGSLWLLVSTLAVSCRLQRSYHHKNRRVDV